tara:strand:- start:604 stop:843 length:240 start_codon:yes stop_codon:yes gene_type:complete
MRLLILIGCAVAISGVDDETRYHQGDLVEREQIQIVYLPNNTCHVEGASVQDVANYKDYVRACLNNQHLRVKMRNVRPN